MTKMKVDIAKTSLSHSAASLEFTEECRHQSKLASLADRADVDLMTFLDQVLLDNDQSWQ
jgi:hypothetical protein